MEAITNEQVSLRNPRPAPGCSRVYWLVAAESGYLGIIAFLLLLLRPLIVAFLCSWRNSGDERADLLMGLGVALLAVYIHSFWESAGLDFEAHTRLH